jgi:hypothetical protein
MPRGLGLYLAASLSKTGKDVALIDLSGSVPTTGLSALETETTNSDEFARYDLGAGLVLLQPKSGAALSAISLQGALAPLRNDDNIRLILTPTLPDGAAQVAAVTSEANAAIITAKPGKSTRQTIDRAQSIVARYPNLLSYLIIE